MTELKTLKDLEEHITKQDLSQTGGELLNDEKGCLLGFRLARYEAIKWIKELSKGGFRKTPEIKFTKEGLDTAEVHCALITKETDIVVRWIKHFFNITEEDLK